MESSVIGTANEESSASRENGASRIFREIRPNSERVLQKTRPCLKMEGPDVQSGRASRQD